MTKYNKTQLTPQKEFERHIYHRDQFAHYLRWTHVLKNAKIGQSILDFGCGTGELLELMYRNKFRPSKYIGLDIRETTINQNIDKFSKLDFAEFKHQDLCKEFDLHQTFDMIISFEVLEHIGKHNIDAYLDNIAFHCNDETLVLISTPNYDPSVGAAKNHIINGEIGEWDHYELEQKLSEYFTIKNKYGTFASQKDYKPLLNDWQIKMFDELKQYYDSNMMSVIMAPMFPEASRNTLWVLKLKGEE